MDTVITVLQVILALVFTAGGLTRLLLPYAKYTNLPGQGWANEFKPAHVRLIGFLEALAAAVIVVSLFLDSVTILTPLAAVGIALVLSGAIATHLRREEYWNIAGNLMWLTVALVVAYDTLIEFAV